MVMAGCKGLWLLSKVMVGCKGMVITIGNNAYGNGWMQRSMVTIQGNGWM